MTHLMLSFSAEREMEEVIEKDGFMRVIPTGRESVEFTIMDTDRGQVTEIEADCFTVEQKMRKPTPGELGTASKLLHKGTGETAPKAELDIVRTEMNSYRQKTLSAEKIIEQKTKIINELEKEVARLRATGDFNETDRKTMGAALDEHTETLANMGKFDEYERAKKLFKRVTGRGWTSEDDESEDDPESDSRCSCGVDCQCGDGTDQPETTPEDEENDDGQDELKREGELLKFKFNFDQKPKGEFFDQISRVMQYMEDLEKQRQRIKKQQDELRPQREQGGGSWHYYLGDHEYPGRKQGKSTTFKGWSELVSRYENQARKDVEEQTKEMLDREKKSKELKKQISKQALDQARKQQRRQERMKKKPPRGGL